MAGASHHRRELHRSSKKRAALAESMSYEACRMKDTDTGTKSCQGKPSAWASSAHPSPEKQSRDWEQW